MKLASHLKDRSKMPKHTTAQDLMGIGVLSKDLFTQ